MIEVKNLSKKFIKKINGRGLKGIIFPEKKEYEAVKNINLKVKKGEIIAFVGPNGAGKSTTIKMLTGIIHPTSGEISVAGFNPTKDRKKWHIKLDVCLDKSQVCGCTYLLLILINYMVQCMIFQKKS